MIQSFNIIRQFKDFLIITIHLQKIHLKLFSNYLYFLKNIQNLKIQKLQNLDTHLSEDKFHI
jgi:hypothetical protein